MNVLWRMRYCLHVRFKRKHVWLLVEIIFDSCGYRKEMYHEFVIKQNTFGTSVNESKQILFQYLYVLFRYVLSLDIRRIKMWCYLQLECRLPCSQL